MSWGTLAAERMSSEFAADEWSALAGSLRQLDSRVTLNSFSSLPWWALPEPRPGRELYEKFKGLAAAPSLRAEAQSRTGSARTHNTAQRDALRATIARHSREEARRAIRECLLEPSSRAAYASSTQVYREWCSEIGVRPYPAEVSRIEDFAGYLRLTQTEEEDGFRAPYNLVKAIVAENKSEGHGLSDPSKRIRSVVAALQKKSPNPEQEEPLGLAQWRLVFSEIETQDQLNAGLQLLAEHFTLLRTSSMQSLRTSDVELGKRTARVVWRVSKGEGEGFSNVLEFEEIDLVPPLSLSKALAGVSGRSIPYCPVRVFRALKSRAGGNELLCPYTSYPSFYKALVGGAGKRDAERGTPVAAQP
ncbi:hypothetical protein DIPPA_16059 [Diplonema papillatum]|nr:hypothetical protein DIPPA_19666 [Diplonema papillatum]KAJ9463140.1 hypothetical protein DIPPA_16059 [Diplonema papillatum]